MGEAILAVLGMAFAAFCVWLTVRIVNRRERWAIRTAIALALLLIYALSFGPACGLSLQADRLAVYRPCAYLACGAPDAMSRPMRWWIGVCGGMPTLMRMDLDRITRELGSLEFSEPIITIEQPFDEH